MMVDRCANCNRYAKFIFLDSDGNCLSCSEQYGYDDKATVFSLMVSDKHGTGYTWAEWEKITEQLEGVDFGCVFDSGGCIKRQCADRRACCSACGVNFAYFKTLPAEAVDFATKNFVRGNGFWRPTGCVLPWKWRSSTCVSYRCPAVRENEDASLWPGFYKAVGLGERQHLSSLIKLPRSVNNDA
jgi:hypothetical protein